MKMLTIAAALATATTARMGAAVRANKVCVVNLGGYDLNWWVTDLVTGVDGTNSGSYPIDQTRCQDIEIYGLQDGDFLEVYVHADAGVTKAGDTALIYQA